MAVGHEFRHELQNLTINICVLKFCIIPSGPCLLDKEFKALMDGTNTYAKPAEFMENKKSQAIYYLHAFFISGLK
jgi:hypothetical protein